MKTGIGIATLCALSFALQAQAKPDLSKAEALLKADVGTAKQEIAKLSGEEAAVMISQVRHLAAPRNPDLDKVVYLLEHAETIKATALAQRRLNNLLVVLIGTLLLFAGYLLFVSFEQRGVIQRLERVAAGKPVSLEQEKKVFRGEA